MSRQIDAKVAEAMGLEVFLSKEDYFAKGAPHAMTFEEKIEYPAYYHKERQVSQMVLDYSTSIEAACSIENWIKTERPGLKWKYAETLERTLDRESPFYTDAHRYWALLTATPLQRCLAFLKVMGVEGE